MVFWPGDNDKLHFAKQELLNQIINLEISISGKGFFIIDRQLLTGVIFLIKKNKHTFFKVIKKSFSKKYDITFDFQMIAACCTYLLFFIQFYVTATNNFKIALEIVRTHWKHLSICNRKNDENYSKYGNMKVTAFYKCSDDVFTRNFLVESMVCQNSFTIYLHLNVCKHNCSNVRQNDSDFVYWKNLLAFLIVSGNSPLS